MKLDAPNPDAKHVDGTRLVYSSPSAIESFNVKSTWGCQRKWWFEQVAGIKLPPDASQAKGEAIHKQIEHYLFTGTNQLGPEASHGKHNIDEIRDRHAVFQLEQWIPKGFSIAGIGIRGRLDFTGRDVKGRITGIADWKTSSSIAKYGKLPNQLRSDTQMLVYRQAAEEQGCLDALPMSLVYFQTKGRASEIVETKIDRKQLAAGMRDIIYTLEEMKTVAPIRDSEDVPADRSKCDIGRGCPHKQRCMKGTPMGSLLDRLRGSAAPAAAPAAPAPSGPAPIKAAMIATPRKLEIQDVLPPDAPESDPALASAPAEAAAPQDNGIVPAPRRGPGRPPGATNKPKDTIEAKAEPKAVPTMTLTEVTVSQGITLNLGDYQSARVDVTLKASLSHGFDAEKARAELSAKVAAAVQAEAERYMPDSK